MHSATTFSVQRELRALLCVAVLSISAGVALLLKDTLQQTRPPLLIGTVLLAAAFSYAMPVRVALRRLPRGLVGDYLLLLGALLLSAALGYAESQYRWFGEYWPRHLLLLAALHGVSAYVLDSRLLLALSLSTLAAWAGLDPRLGNLSGVQLRLTPLSAEALSIAMLVQLWHYAHAQLLARQNFAEVFNQFSLNLAFWAALGWCARADTRWWGLLLLAAVAGIALLLAFRQRRQTYAVYGIGYTAAGAGMVIVDVLHDDLTVALSMLLVIAAAATSLWRLRDRLAESA